MAEGKNTRKEISREGLDAFIRKVENGGAVGGVSTSNFSIEQLIALEELEKDRLLAVELRTALVPACIIMVKGVGGEAEKVKSM